MFLVKNGQVEQLSLLFQKYHVRLFNFFIGMTGDRAASEDLTQEVFLRILRFRQTFKGKGTFKSWMFQIARNVSIDYFRKQRKTDSLDDRFHDIIVAESTPYDESVQDQETQILHQALDRLSFKHREVLMLARFQEMPLKEVADVLKCPVNTVKVRVHRAIKELGAIYSELTGVQQHAVR